MQQNQGKRKRPRTYRPYNRYVPITATTTRSRRNLPSLISALINHRLSANGTDIYCRRRFSENWTDVFSFVHSIHSITMRDDSIYAVCIARWMNRHLATRCYACSVKSSFCCMIEMRYNNNLLLLFSFKCYFITVIIFLLWYWSVDI